MPQEDELKKVEEVEKRILKEEDKIEEAEDHIDNEEARIEKAEKKIISSIDKHPIRALLPGGFNARELGIVKTIFTRRVTRHRLIMTIIATIGVVLVWRGIWHVVDGLPFFSIALVSLVVGIIILWLIQRYTDL